MKSSCCRSKWAAAYPLWLAILAALLLAAPASQLKAQESTSVTVRLQAPAQVAVGEVIPLTVQVSGGASIAGMDALTVFDATAAEFAGFYPTTAGTQSGLGMLVVPETPAGAAVGFFTCTTPECQEIGTALASMANAGIAAVAPDLLATVELLPLVEGPLEIHLDNVQIVDSTGRPLAVAVEQGSVVVQVGTGGDAHPAPVKPWEMATAQSADAAAVADMTGDGMITYADVMETAMSWQLVHEQMAPCGGAESMADLNHDGCVTVADIQLAAAQVGNPVPEDEPQPVDPVQLPNHLYLPSLDSNGEGMAASNLGDAASVDMAAALTFVVNAITDQADAKIGDGLCRTANGECTLRAAIAEANNHGGADNINFAIPGSGIKTIQLNSRLPSLSDASGGTTIDGYTQPGSAVNTDSLVSNARLLIEVKGQGLAFDALAVTSSNNVIRGMSFYNFKRSLWIYGSGAKQNIVTGSFIGTDATSTFGAATGTTQQAHGINIEQGAQSNRIGGTTPAERNVISGNQRSGIGIWHWPTNFNLIYNNVIGLSATTDHRLANRAHGIDINFGASSNQIGGMASGQRNIVSGNSIQGIEVSHGTNTSHNEIVGNFVGTYAGGNLVGGTTRNNGFGIQLKDRVSNNHVANNVIANNGKNGIMLDNFGTCCLQDNVIENNRIGIGLNGRAIGNQGSGIRVLAPNTRIGPNNIIANNADGGIVIEGDANDRNTITQNSIFANVGLGIDLAPVGAVNANDAQDTDSGPNEQLNFPVITRAWPDHVTGTTCGGCRVELFIADGQAGANGEARPS